MLTTLRSLVRTPLIFFTIFISMMTSCFVISLSINNGVYILKDYVDSHLGNLANFSSVSLQLDKRKLGNHDLKSFLSFLNQYGKIDITNLEKEIITSKDKKIKAIPVPILYTQKTDWTPPVSKGNYFNPISSPTSNYTVLIGKEISKGLQIGIGDSLSFYGQDYK